MTPFNFLKPMTNSVTQIVVGNMSPSQRYLSVAAGVVFALTLVFAGLAITGGSEAVPDGDLKVYWFVDKDGYCDDQEAGPCDRAFKCENDCEDDDACCPSTVTEETDLICEYGCVGP